MRNTSKKLAFPAMAAAAAAVFVAGVANADTYSFNVDPVGLNAAGDEVFGIYAADTTDPVAGKVESVDVQIIDTTSDLVTGGLTPGIAGGGPGVDITGQNPLTTNLGGTYVAVGNGTSFLVGGAYANGVQDHTGAAFTTGAAPFNVPLTSVRVAGFQPGGVAADATVNGGLGAQIGQIVVPDGDSGTVVIAAAAATGAGSSFSAPIPFGPPHASSGSTVVTTLLPGDSNFDGSVDGNDIGNWLAGYTGTLPFLLDANGNVIPGQVINGIPEGNWTTGDWNNDGSVDGNDVSLWLANYTGTLVPFVVPSDANPAALAELRSLGIQFESAPVPEPTSLGLIAVASVGLLARRRRTN